MEWILGYLVFMFVAIAVIKLFTLCVPTVGYRDQYRNYINSMASGSGDIIEPVAKKKLEELTKKRAAIDLAR